MRATWGMILGLCLGVSSAGASTVIHPDAENAPLSERWKWALTQAARQDAENVWIAYRVDRWMDPQIFFVWSKVQRPGLRGASLVQQLGDAGTVPAPETALNKPRDGESLRPLAILVAFSTAGEIRDIELVDLGQPIALGDRSLLWLGSASRDASLDLLIGADSLAVSRRAREELIEIIGLHDAAAAVSFLDRIIGSSEPSRLRQEAVESLAEQTDSRVLPILQRVAREDVELKVRQEAVETIGEVSAPGVLAVLEELARTASTTRVRQEAVESIGEVGTAEAHSILEDILWNGGDARVQEEALESLVESRGEPLDLLIDVARRHPRKRVREEAID